MQVPHPPPTLFPTTPDNFLITTGTTYRQAPQPNPHLTPPQTLELLHKIINTLGQLSAKSQGLKQVVTSVAKFANTNQRLYVKVQGGRVIGFVKVGERSLFYRDFSGNVKELYPTCVLDIYVHESCQRSGYGKQIFQKMLKQQSTTAQKLAYDRPSPKLISFLKKHYQLSEFVPQNNNFVIFNRFFSADLGTGHYNQTNKSTQMNMFYNHTLYGRTGSSFQRSGGFGEQGRNGSSSREKLGYGKMGGVDRDGEKKIVDSLQMEMLKKQAQRNKLKSNQKPQHPQQHPSTKPQPYHQTPQNPKHQPQTARQYHPESHSISINYTTQPHQPHQLSNLNNTLQKNGRYSLNMKLKDLSFRVPWAQVQGGDSGSGFRTTSNAYGSFSKY